MDVSRAKVVWTESNPEEPFVGLCGVTDFFLIESVSR